MQPMDFMRPMTPAQPNATDTTVHDTDQAVVASAAEEQTPGQHSPHVVEEASPETDVGVQPTTVTSRPRRSTASKVPITQIDTSEQKKNVTMMAYPSLQRQMADLEFIERRHRWKIMTQAWVEYAERHHGVKPPAALSDDSY